MRLTSVTNAGWIGVTECMAYGHKVLGTGNLVLIENSMVGLNKAIQDIAKSNPEILQICGYGPNFDAIIKLMGAKCRIVVKWCSNILQSELTNEMTGLGSMMDHLKAGRIYAFTCIHEPTARALKEMYPHARIFYSPEVVVEKPAERRTLTPEGFHYDVFCTPDGRKNIYNQLLGLHGVGTGHVNYANPNYMKLLEQFPQVQNHGKLSEKDFTGIGCSVDLCSQVSANESLNLIAAEHMFWGIPVLTSRFNPIMMEAKDKLIRKHLVVEQIDDPCQIREKAMKMKDDPELRKELGEICRNEITRIAEDRKQRFIELFDTLNRKG